MMTVTGTAPASWASALINGDWSSIGTAESIEVGKFRDWLISGDPRGSIVDCGDEFFAHRHDATQFGTLGAMCCTYTALIRESVNV